MAYSCLKRSRSFLDCQSLLISACQDKAGSSLEDKQ